MHFVDAEDDVPSSCSVDLSRDCGPTGCIATAIQNYTSRVLDTSLSSEQQKEALAFLVHFFGDATQPLHNEAVERGGNGITVRYKRAHTNLHHVWDTNMLEELAGGTKLEDAETWSQTLVQAITDGAYKDVASSWVSGLSLADPSGSALWMSQDANAFVCSYVLKDGIAAVQDVDLSQEYYQGAVPVLEMQIAKGGYRLAWWLNGLAAQAGGGSGAGAGAGAVRVGGAVGNGEL